MLVNFNKIHHPIEIITKNKINNPKYHSYLITNHPKNKENNHPKNKIITNHPKNKINNSKDHNHPKKYIYQASTNNNNNNPIKIIPLQKW